MIDTILPVGVLFLIVFVSAEPIVRARQEPDRFADAGHQMVVFALVVAVVGIQLFQYWLIAARGQTIGKKLFGIRIVREDGSPVGFWDGVVKREFVIEVLTWIPYVGGLIRVIDTLSIFTTGRRTLHDRIAGTIVVRADSIPAAGVQRAYGSQPSHAPPPGRYGPPPGTGMPSGLPAPDLLAELRSAPLTPERVARVNARMQELARTDASREAIDLYRAAQGRENISLSDRALLIAEQAAAQAGEAELAVSIVRDLMSTHPHSELIPRAMWDVAQIQRKLGRDDLARATLESLVKRWPADPFAQQAQVRLRSGW